MKVFGLEIRRAEKALAAVPVPDHRNGWRRIMEPFSGAWQRNVSEKRGDLLCYPTLYGCLSRISTDIGKLPFVLKREDQNGIWQPTEDSAYSSVLRKPNHFQNGQQFREAWMLSVLQNGNTYILKRRNNRDVVDALYVLDASCVMPMISESGDVFYQLNYSTAENLLPLSYPAKQIIVPAREIIHHRVNCLHHQLVGVPPLCAAYWPTVKNLKILKDSTQFFSNGAQPGGILTAPAGLSDDDAAAVKAYWDANFTGEHRGKVAVIGADMKYTPFSFNAADSQLVEQMQYSDRQVCQPFGVPPFMVGIGEIPAGLKTDDITNTYYQLALQSYIEAMEYLLDEGLQISRPLGVEMDLEPLLRMDISKKAAVMVSLTNGKLLTPNEGRKQLGYGPIDGGDVLWAQHQDYPLGVLADRTDVK